MNPASTFDKAIAAFLGDNSVPITRDGSIEVELPSFALTAAISQSKETPNDVPAKRQKQIN